MGIRGVSIITALGALSGVVNSQFPPKPTGVTVLESKIEEGIRISYKEDPENAPLSIWMNGGPGSSSMLGLLRENGPCYVNSDSNSTHLSEWAWNNEVQVGLSYDTLTNVTVNTDTGAVKVANFTNGDIPEQNNTFYVGTYPSQNRNLTTQGSENSARALWHFAQVWFQEFPGYKPNDNRISLATESYGGRYGPATMAYFQEQNERIENGTWSESGQTHILHLDTLLIINGCVDRLVQWPGYPMMAYNNTYSIKAYNESRYEAAMDALYNSTGCLAQIEQCRNLSLLYDPTNQGFNTSVNRICQAAESFCTEQIRDPYFDSDVNYYDISSPAAASFPPPWYEGFLNQPHVQQSLGVPLNWTQSNSAVSAAFRGIGDYPRPGWKEDLAYLLEQGIKVTLVYGDRDYACNWYGGELLSLAINYANTSSFAEAGYAPVYVNDSYIGGQVRQYGNLSFTRVYEAGHEVPAYQPETAYKIFTRSLFNRDISTGNISTAQNQSYASQGPQSVANITNKGITDPGSQCYVLDRDQCTEEQWESVMNGSAEVRNWIVVDANTSSLFPDLGKGNASVNATRPSGGAAPSGSASASAAAVARIGSLELGVNVALAVVIGSLMMVL